MTKAPWTSWVVAALFAIHPMHVEAVAWIAERKELLSGLFGLLAMGAYTRYAQAPRRRTMALVFLWMLLGLLCKPMLVTLPCLLLLLDIWPLGRLHPFEDPAAPAETPVEQAGHASRGLGLSVKFRPGWLTGTQASACGKTSSFRTQRGAQPEQRDHQQVGRGPR